MTADTTPPGSASPEPQPAPAAAPPSWARRIFIGPNGVRAGWRLLLWMLITVVIMLVLGLVLALIPATRRIILHRPAGVITPALMLVNDLLPFASIALAAAAMGRIERRPFGAYGLPGRGAFGGRFWQGFIWGLALITVILGAIALFHGFLPGAVALSGRGVVRYGLLWLIAFLAVGFFEEFAFRGYSLATLASGIGFWPAAVVLSLLFGAAHLGNSGEGYIGVLEVVLIGLFFCFTLRRTGTLWFAVGLHTAFDWGETFLYSVPDSGMVARGHLLASSLHGPAWLTGGSVGPEASVFSFLFTGVAFVVFARLYPVRRAGEKLAVATAGVTGGDLDS